MSELQLSRRNILKTTAVSALAAAIGSDFNAKNTFAAAPKTAKDDEKYHYGFCRMCHRGTCGVKTRIKNGVAVETLGNTECPTNKGAQCAKGKALLQNLYNAYRVKVPMKRTNPKKGLNEDPRWVEITWEEALKTTAAKLKEVREKDPRRFIYQVGFGDMDFFCTFLFYFGDAFGTPNYLKSNGTLCVLHYATDLTQGVFPSSMMDVAHAKYILAIGMNMGMGIAATEGGNRDLVNKLINKEIKLVCVDPRCGPEASKAEWVPIRPGGELAFMLGIANSIIFEVKRMDFEFLRWKTNAPYLIGPDGYYFRGAEGKPLIYDESDKKVKTFDDKSLKTPSIDVENITVNGVKTNAAFVLIKNGLKKYTPEWSAKVSGIPAKKIREIAKDFIDNASIGKTIDLKNDKGETVKLPLRTSICQARRGVLNQRDGVASDLMTKLISMLVGSLDVPGGLLGCVRGPEPLAPDADGIVEPKMEARYTEPVYPPQHLNMGEYFPHRHTLPVVAYKVAGDPHKYGLDYEIDAILTVGGNPIASTSEPFAIADTISKIPFAATVAYEFDEMAQLADILLPSHCVLEREGVNIYEGAFDFYTEELFNTNIFFYRDPVPPVYNTRQPQDIIIELCDRIGMIDEFNDAVNKTGVILSELTWPKLDPEEQLKPGKRYTIQEIWNKGAMKRFGITLDDMKKTGVYAYKMPTAEAFNSYWYKKGETRHPIYFDRFKKSGELLDKFFTANKDKLVIPDFNWEDHKPYYEAVIQYRPKKLTNVKKGDKYDLIFINWKAPTSLMRTSGTDHMPYLNDIGDAFDPTYGTLCISSETAKEKGLKNGDEVWCESENGKIKAKLYVTELIFPGVVGMGGALGRVVDSMGKRAMSYPMVNKLTNGKFSDGCAITGGVANSVPVRVYKA